MPWRIRRAGYVMYAARDTRSDRMVGWDREKAARDHIEDLTRMGWDMSDAIPEPYAVVGDYAPVTAGDDDTG